MKASGPGSVALVGAGEFGATFLAQARRIPDLERLANEVAAWEAERNRTATIIDWRFTTDDARIRSKRVYPTP